MQIFEIPPRRLSVAPSSVYESSNLFDSLRNILEAPKTYLKARATSNADCYFNFYIVSHTAVEIKTSLLVGVGRKGTWELLNCSSFKEDLKKCWELFNALKTLTEIHEKLKILEASKSFKTNLKILTKPSAPRLWTFFCFNFDNNLHRDELNKSSRKCKIFNFFYVFIWFCKLFVTVWELFMKIYG